MSLVYFVPAGAVYAVAQFVSLKTTRRLDFSDPLHAVIASFGQSMTINLLMTAALTVVGAFFTGGMYRAAFRQLDGESISVADVFSGIYLFPRILLISAISGALQLMAAFLCYFPLFIVQGLFFLAVPLVVRRDMDPMEALSHSYQTAKPEWLMFAVVALVSGLLSGVGIFLCVVGVLFSYPLIFLISAAAYKDIFERTESITTVSTKPCRICGTVLPQQANFCDRCGSGQV